MELTPEIETVFRSYYLDHLAHRIGRPLSDEEVIPLVRRCLAERKPDWWQNAKGNKERFRVAMTDLVNEVEALIKVQEKQ